MDSPICGGETLDGPCQRRVKVGMTDCGMHGSLTPPQAAVRRTTASVSAQTKTQAQGGRTHDVPSAPASGVFGVVPTSAPTELTDDDFGYSEGSRPLTPSEVAYLERVGFDLERLAAYPRHLAPVTVPELVAAGISPDEAARWPHRFPYGSEIVALREAQLTPTEAAQWPMRFSGHDIAVMHTVSLTPEEAAKWADRFDGESIVYLHRRHFEPEFADGYPEWLTAPKIARLYELGIQPSMAMATLAEPMTNDDFEFMLSTI